MPNSEFAAVRIEEDLLRLGGVVTGGFHGPCAVRPIAAPLIQDNAPLLRVPVGEILKDYPAISAIPHGQQAPSERLLAQTPSPL